MYSLSILTHPIAAPLRIPQRIRKFVNIEYEEHMLQRPYIGNQLDYDFKNWRKEKTVVIKAPTGTGKSRTITTEIIPYAVKKGLNVLIIVNRSPLNISYKKEIAKIVGMENCYTDEGLQHICEFGNIFIVHYQGLESFISNHKHIDFSYVICDECHYFLQDASYTDCTGYALDIIPKEFANAVRIYISATIDEILPYITRAELGECSVDDNGNCWYYDSRIGKYSSINSLIPTVYRMDSDYSKVDLQFFESTEYLTEYLRNQSSKVMSFCDSKKECANFAESMGGGLVIYSEFLRENPEVLKELVENESFDEKCMCSTTVFSNGNNICDKSVKSVVITLTDPTEIVQMAGRRRMDYADENDCFTLYIKIPDLKKITQKIMYIRKLQEEINKCKQSYVYLMNIIKDGNDDIAKIIRGVFRVNRQTQKYEINYLCEDKLHMDLYHLDHIYALINEGGKEAYCELIAKKFDKEFDNDMIFGSFELRKGELKDFINGYGCPLTYGEFEEFREDFQKERIRLFGISKADNFGAGRKTPASKSINNRLAEIGLGIKIARNDNLYYIENTIEEEIE